MSTLDERLASTPQQLNDMLLKPFPSLADEPNDNYAYERYQIFLANAPRRLISILCADYTNMYSDDADSFDDAYKNYEKIFFTAVAATESLFGPCLKLQKPGYRQLAAEWGVGNKLGSIEQSPHIMFDDTVFAFDTAAVAYWAKGDRFAVVHFAGQQGDGDYQLSVCACVVPNDGNAERLYE